MQSTVWPLLASVSKALQSMPVTASRESIVSATRTSCAVLRSPVLVTVMVYVVKPPAVAVAESNDLVRSR